MLTVTGWTVTGLTSTGLASVGRATTASAAGTASTNSASEMQAYANALQRRAKVAKVHRPLGIATWAAMGLTSVFGVIQFYNLYGARKLEDTPCVVGNAILGQGQCSGTPAWHSGLARATGVLYAATFTLSLLMPDPGISKGDSEYARNLRKHKTLRWVHFAGMITQVALGVFIANADRYGLDRANDYGAMRRLSIVHAATGTITFGAMTWAALTMM